MAKQTIRDLDPAGKRVLMRVDFNVPLDQGKVADDTRIRAALPTIQYLMGKGAKTILVSHLGRPEGADDTLRMHPVAGRLAELLGKPVTKLDDCVGPMVEAAAAKMNPGDVVLLENVRFHAEEEKNDPAFAAKLAKLADLYVNDAFGTAHRAHASTEGVAKLLPAVAGFLMEKELAALGGALTSPARPFVAILGGAKVKDKLGVIENLITKVDTLLLGGGMAYTFLAAKGDQVGKSLLDASKIEMAKGLMEKAKASGVKLELPVDVVITTELKLEAERKTVAADQIPADWMGADIGPKTCELFAAALKGAKTVVWNGPMGVFELAPLAAGTHAIAQAMADCGGNTIIGGGESVQAVEQMGFADKISHISTGGGASLEFLEGKKLPGVEALRDK